MAFPLRRRTIRAGWMLAAAVAGLQLGRAAPPVRAEAELASVVNDYVLRVWETDDGLPQNTVTGIAQTPDGYLWPATQGGLVRFEGVRFTSYLKGTTPGLESSYARGLVGSRGCVADRTRAWRRPPKLSRSAARRSSPAATAHSSFPPLRRKSEGRTPS